MADGRLFVADVRELFEHLTDRRAGVRRRFQAGDVGRALLYVARLLSSEGVTKPLHDSSTSSAGSEPGSRGTTYFPKRGRPAPADPERLDSICNIAPISEFTNRWIGKRPPEEYLAAILDRGVPRARLEQILARHLIPIELMHPKRLDDFYAHRRAAILGLAHAALRDRGTHPVLDLCRGRRVLGRRRGRSAF